MIGLHVCSVDAPDVGHRHDRHKSESRAAEQVTQSPMCHTFAEMLTRMRNDAFYRSVDSRLRGNDGGEDARNDGHGIAPLD